MQAHCLLLVILMSTLCEGTTNTHVPDRSLTGLRVKVLPQMPILGESVSRHPATGHKRGLGDLRDFPVPLRIRGGESSSPSGILRSDCQFQLSLPHNFGLEHGYNGGSQVATLQLEYMGSNKLEKSNIPMRRGQHVDGKDIYVATAQIRPGTQLSYRYSLRGQQLPKDPPFQITSSSDGSPVTSCVEGTSDLEQSFWQVSNLYGVGAVEAWIVDMDWWTEDDSEAHDVEGVVSLAAGEEASAPHIDEVDKAIRTANKKAGWSVNPPLAVYHFTKMLQRFRSDTRLDLGKACNSACHATMSGLKTLCHYPKECLIGLGVAVKDILPIVAASLAVGGAVGTVGPHAMEKLQGVDFSRLTQFEGFGNPVHQILGKFTSKVFGGFFRKAASTDGVHAERLLAPLTVAGTATVLPAYAGQIPLNIQGSSSSSPASARSSKPSFSRIKSIMKALKTSQAEGSSGLLSRSDTNLAKWLRRIYRVPDGATTATLRRDFPELMKYMPESRQSHPRSLNKAVVFARDVLVEVATNAARRGATVAAGAKEAAPTLLREVLVKGGQIGASVRGWIPSLVNTIAQSRVPKGTYTLTRKPVGMVTKSIPTLVKDLLKAAICKLRFPIKPIMP